MEQERPLGQSSGAAGAAVIAALCGTPNRRGRPNLPAPLGVPRRFLHSASAPADPSLRPGTAAGMEAHPRSPRGPHRHKPRGAHGPRRFRCHAHRRAPRSRRLDRRRARSRRPSGGSAPSTRRCRSTATACAPSPTRASAASARSSRACAALNGWAADPGGRPSDRARRRRPRRRDLAGAGRAVRALRRADVAPCTRPPARPPSTSRR